MLHKSSRKISDYLVKKGIIEEGMVEVYQYGFELILSFLLTNISIIIISCWIDSIMIGIMYMLVFVPLKMTCGGYHASTYARCYIVSITSYIGVSFITKFLSSLQFLPIIWIGILFISIVYIYKNTPVKNKNHPVSEQTLQKNKKISIVLMVMYLVGLTVAYICYKQSDKLNFIVITIMSVALSILPTKKKGE